MARSTAHAQLFSSHTVLTLVALIALMGVTNVVRAETVDVGSVSGFNQYLLDHKGLAFIPQKPATSGWLGEFNGRRIVGAKADTITVNGKGATSTGYLNYTLYFGLNNGVSPSGEPVVYSIGDVKTDTMKLYLDLTDIDFATVTGQGRNYNETLTLTFLRDDPMFNNSGQGQVPTDDYPNVDPSYPALTIDESNYGNFRTDGFGPTNNQKAQYEIAMDDLGLNMADYNQLIDNMAFRLVVTLTSTTTRTQAGSGRYVNTREYLGDYSSGNLENGFSGSDGIPANGLTFEVPEPMTLSLLGIGGLALLRRRRR